MLRSLPAGRLEVEALAWSPESDLVATGTKDGTVRVWPVKEGLPSNDFFLGTPGVSNIQFAPDGPLLLAGFRRDMMMWDLATGEQVLTGRMGVPSGFSQDGRCFAAGGILEVAFCDLVMPRAVRHFSGHRTPVRLLSWCRNNRRLASLDSRFEARVWSMEPEPAVSPLLVPPGGFYAPEAAVALSDDGRQLAYASGGEDKAHALIYEIPGWKKLGEWPLSGGFEKLACVRGREFVLVREQLDEDGQNVHTVAWTLEAGKEPVGPTLIRPSRPGDERRFHGSELTRDGRYYSWLGPRRPENSRRVELFDVATGKPLIQRELPRNPHTGNFWGTNLNPDGRYLWIWEPEGAGEVWRYDLSDLTHPPRRQANGLGGYLSPDGQWVMWGSALKRTDEDRPWTLLAEGVAAIPSVITAATSDSQR